MNRFTSCAALAVLLALTACGAPHSGGSGLAPVVPSSAERHILDQLGGGPPMSLNVAMYDAPLPAGSDAQVNIAIAGLDIMSDGVAHPLVTYDAARTVDLLTLKRDALTLGGTIPAGSYDAVRLLVDTAHSNVTVNGQVFPVVFAGRSHHRHRRASESAIVALDAKASIAGNAGDSLAVAIDFNVLESISLRHGVAYVRPKLVVAHQPGRVSGTVRNGSGAPVEHATVVATDRDGNVVNTTLTENDGSFVIHALHSGAYRIAVRNEYTTEGGDIVVATGASRVVGPVVDVVVSAYDVIELGTLSD